MGMSRVRWGSRSAVWLSAWISVSMMPGRTPLMRDAFADQLAPEAARQHVHGALAGGVVHIDVGRAVLRGAARQIDDAASAPPSRVLMRRAAGVGAQQQALHIDVKEPLPALGRGVQEARGRRHDAGVVDQACDGAQTLVDGLEHAAHLVSVGDVGLRGTAPDAPGRAPRLPPPARRLRHGGS